MGKHSKTEARVDPWKVLIESSSNSNSDSNAVSVKKTAAAEPKPKKSKKDRNESVSSEKSVKSTSTKKRKRDREDSAASSKRSDKKHKKAKSGDSVLDDEPADEATPVVQGSVKRAREQAGQGRTSDQPSDEDQGVSFFELLRQEREADKVQETKVAERKKRNAELEAREVEALLLERAARKTRKEEKKAEKIARKELEKREKKERKRKDREASAAGVETEGPPVSPFTEPKSTDSGLGSEKDQKKSKRPETKRTVSDRASIAKVPATEPAKGAEVLEKWNVGGLEGGSQRQSKFARLLGAKKQGIPVESGAGNGTSRQGLDQSRVTNDLEKQFEYGRKMKHESGGQKRGLGA